jgi:hypothetical protein
MQAVLSLQSNVTTFNKILFLLLLYKMSPWTDLVSKVFKEGRDKDSSYQLKDAMKEASKRKSEMGSSSSAAAPSKSKKSKKKRGKSKKSKKRGKSRKNKK